MSVRDMYKMRDVINYKAPDAIPHSCKECNHFRKTGIIDIYLGHCNFYDEDRHSNWSCIAYDYLRIAKDTTQALQIEKEITERAAPLPADIFIPGGFNWGAFVFSPLWLLFHGRIGTGIFLIILSIVFRALSSFGVGWVILNLLITCLIMFNYGFTGNAIAWGKKGYTSVEELQAKQRGWNIAGIVGVIIGLLILTTTVISLIKS